MVIRHGYWWGWTPADVVKLGKVTELDAAAALKKYSNAKPLADPQFVGAGRL